MFHPQSTTPIVDKSVNFLKSELPAGAVDDQGTNLLLDNFKTEFK
jgi:hypothetical protein